MCFRRWFSLRGACFWRTPSNHVLFCWYCFFLVGMPEDLNPEKSTSLTMLCFFFSCSLAILERLNPDLRLSNQRCRPFALGFPENGVSMTYASQQCRGCFIGGTHSIRSFCKVGWRFAETVFVLMPWLKIPTQTNKPVERTWWNFSVGFPRGVLVFSRLLAPTVSCSVGARLDYLSELS